ncbi:ABC transporter ATP-binding protein [Nocardioides eburneiflavus]|uniref:ABC transporter ATP-binding protein n=1 Tax=Nocardioides eburneiflavus TaxID=2518372 RepID=A0A4Z1CPU8_9ACTN|nr:ABC transporter ATP-binding protein [Nocardioides eburneiflavus]
MNGSEAPVLVVEGLTKAYQSRGREPVVAASEVSFELRSGGSLGIVGESGSGKTTTAKMLIGLEKPTSGRILLNGVDHTDPPKRVRDWRSRGRQIQMVFQDPFTSLDRRQRVRDCLLEVVRIHGSDSGNARARVDELAEMVGLDQRQLRAMPRALSGGQRQRVAIARALAAEPRIVILDEAVSALDVSIQAQILNLLADIREQTGVSYLFISHDLAVIRQLTDDTIVMRDGLVVERGTTADVLDRPTHAYTQLLRDSVPRPGWRPPATRQPELVGATSSEAAPTPSEEPTS